MDMSRSEGPASADRQPSKPFSDRAFAMIKTAFGIPDRPDTRFLVEITLLLLLVAFALFAISWYDDNIGYLRNVKHQIHNSVSR